VIDMGYHMAVTDLREGGTLEELASLPDQGITSYKLFMAYKGALMVDDETLFRTMEVAAETGALVMVHAENGDAIDVLVKKALAEGHTEPHWHALTRPPETEGRGDEPGDPARACGRRFAVRRARVVQGGGRADPACARAQR
jgi:dihydropyrimidinase